MTITIINGALDESSSGSIILRGVVSKDSLEDLKTDDYQRMSFESKNIKGLRKAIADGKSIPNIMLGMRGQRIRNAPGSTTFVLVEQVYIIDGYQRVTAALSCLARNPDLDVRLGCEVHFGTTKDYERDLFETINTRPTRVSSSVLLRNRREDSPIVLTLYGLSNNDREFALFERIQWDQRRARGELLTAVGFAKTCSRLHAHKGPGGNANTLHELVNGLERQAASVGLNRMRQNTKQFVDVVDYCWGLRSIQQTAKAPQVRQNFLHTLARLFSRHANFWRDEERKELWVDADLRNKLKRFSLHDPTIAHLTSATGKAGDHLLSLMIEHMNKGRKKNRLIPIHASIIAAAEEDIDDFDSESED